MLMSGGALAVLVLAIWSMWPSSPAPSAATTPAQARAGQQGQSRPVPVAPVKLDELSAPRQGPADSNRNPFRYQPKAPPPPPPRKAVEKAPVVVDTDEPPRPDVPTGPPPPPPIPLKFLGILTRENGVKWAVLSDGKRVMYGRDGDIVVGQYRIVKIGAESIEVAYVDGRGPQVIRLTGQ
jgi:hypothetical protein